MKKYISKNLGSLIISIIFGLAEVVFIYLATLKVGQIVDSITGLNSGDIRNTLFLAIAYVLAIFVSNNMSYYHIQRFSANTAYDLRQDLINSIIKMDSADYYRKDTSYYINNISTNIDQLRNEYIQKIPFALVGICQTIFYLYGIYRIHRVLMMVTLALIIVPSLVGRVISRKINSINTEMIGINEVFTTKVLDFLNAYLLIKQAKTQKEFIEDFSRANKASLDIKVKHNFVANMLFNAMFSLNILSIVLVVYIGSILVLRSDLELGALVSSITLISVATNEISEAFKYLVQLRSAQSIKEAVLSDLYALKAYDRDQVRHKPDLPIEFSDLTYDYGGNRIFSDLDYKIKEGQCHAVIGPSGSGKSTLAKILMAIKTNYQGKIAFANGDYKDFNEKEIYEKIYLIPQNPFIFTDDFISNITMKSNHVDYDRVEAIIERLGLTKLYETKKDLIVNGSQLSGGEQKKLEIARALYFEKDFLIFDEPSSNLDPLSKDIIEELIFSLKGFTKLVITHNQDPAYLEKFDGIINIEDYK